MKDHIDDTRRQIGELGVMSLQTERMERRILSIAEDRLSEIEGQISDARSKASAGSDGDKSAYTDLIEERGRLNQVIAKARSVLSSA